MICPQRHRESDARAAARRAQELQRAADEGGALAHCNQPQSAAHGTEVEAAALVFDFEVQFTRVEAQAHDGTRGS
jgi:predicted secreted Zn-dependent protease